LLLHFKASAAETAADPIGQFGGVGAGAPSRVSMRWSADTASAVNYRVVIFPAATLDKTHFAMSPDGKPEKWLGKIGLGTIGPSGGLAVCDEPACVALTV
jgi:hypothetical protein